MGNINLKTLPEKLPHELVMFLVRHRLMKMPKKDTAIELTPALFTEKAIEMRSLKCQYDFILGKLAELIAQLGDTWQNDIQSSFIDDFEGVRGSAKELSDIVDEYSSLLDMAANELKKQGARADEASIFQRDGAPVAITLTDIPYLKRSRIDLAAYDPYYASTQQGVCSVIRASRKNGDYMYNVYDDHIELVKYIGLKRTVEIPREIDGLPVTHIGQDCFAMAWRVRISSVVIPDTVTTVFHGAFRGCQQIKSLDLPDSIVYIGNYAFAFLTSLETLDIPKNVRSIGMGAFRNCTSLLTVRIPDNTVRIGNDCFYRCKFLEEVYISNGVADIDGWAFKCCERLERVVLGDNVVNIGASAFYDCICLDKLDIPVSVEQIGDVAFYHRRGMTLGCAPDSVAEEYAKQNKLKYEYVQA